MFKSVILNVRLNTAFVLGKKTMDKNAKNKKNAQDVKQRLIAAGEALFAEKGFSDTSVRDLTKKANCNVASINYYFGGKDVLHLEIYKKHLTALRDMRFEELQKLKIEKGDNISIEDLVRTCVTAFFRPFKNGNEGLVRTKLLWMEIIEPHLPEGLFHTEVVIPVSTAFVDAFQKICPELSRTQILYTFESIVGQLSHSVISRQIGTVSKDKLYDNFSFNDYVEHVIYTTTAGVIALVNKEKINAN